MTWMLDLSSSLGWTNHTKQTQNTDPLTMLLINETLKKNNNHNIDSNDSQNNHYTINLFYKQDDKVRQWSKTFFERVNDEWLHTTY